MRMAKTKNTLRDSRAGGTAAACPAPHGHSEQKSTPFDALTTKNEVNYSDITTSKRFSAQPHPANTTREEIDKTTATQQNGGQN